MHSLSKASRKQHNHRSCIYISWIARRAKILLHMLSICIKHANYELNLWHAHSQAIAHVFFIRSFFFILIILFVICTITFLIIFNICIERILSELSFLLVYARYMRSVTLIFKSCSQLIISFARFSALMLSSFINVSLCSVDAAHMHRRDFDDQMWIYLWSRLMLLTYASHRNWSFSNSTSDLECARHMPILKFNPTSRIFSVPLWSNKRSVIYDVRLQLGSGLYNTCLLPNQIRIVNKRVLYTFIEAGIIHRNIYK